MSDRRLCCFCRLISNMTGPLSERLVSLMLNFMLTKLGKVAKIFFVGDEQITRPEDYLKFTVDQYNTTLAKFHARVGIKTYELVKGSILRPKSLLRSAGLAEKKIDEAQDRTEVGNPFMVPYERNPRFTGRIKYLEALKEKLFDRSPKQHNHRIALYG